MGQLLSAICNSMGIVYARLFCLDIQHQAERFGTFQAATITRKWGGFESKRKINTAGI